MIRSSRSLVATAIALAAPVGTASAQAPAAGDVLNCLPARVVPNQGQWESPELYRMRIGGSTVYLERRGWSFWLRDATDTARPDTTLGPRGGREAAPPASRAVGLRMTFLDSDRPSLIAEQPLRGVEHYLVGRDRAAHHNGVAGFAAVRYAGVYPGVDVRVRDGGGHLEYDLVLAPGADLAQVRIRVEGAESIGVDESGSLIVDTALGPVRQPVPTTWVVTPSGEQRPVECGHVQFDDASFGFAAPLRDASLEMVVDPRLLWATYIGGSAHDEAFELCPVGNGEILLCGSTQSLDFPTSPGVIQTVYAGNLTDGFLMCIDPSQAPANQVVWSTYFGGSAEDEVTGIIALDGGEVAFTGTTTSTDLPVTPNAWQPANAGIKDAFVGVLSPTGTVLNALSYFGDTDIDLSGSISVAPNGDLYLVGTTQSVALPTTANAFSQTHNGGPGQRDGFIARFDAALTTVDYCSYFGGSGDEWLWCGDCDRNGVLTMISGTNSSDFPVTANAFDRTFNGGSIWWSADCGIVRLDPSRPAFRQLVYGTYLGHAGGQDFPWAVRISARNEIVVSGITSSRGFPTTPGAYQTRFQGNSTLSNLQAGDGFVTKIDPSRSGAAGLVASTFFGGPDSDRGFECDLDPTGEVTLCGWSHANNSMPTTPGALRRTPAGGDGYVARLSADLGQLLFCSYLGGSGSDEVLFLDHHAPGVVTVCGQTTSADVPMRNGFQTVHPGDRTPFVARISTVPSGVIRRGAPTPYGDRKPTMHALADATPGNAPFGLACTAGPPNGQGFLLICARPAPATPMLGVDLWVDLSSVVVATLVTASGSGEHVLGLPLPPALIGTLHTQYVWIEHLPTLRLSASDALQIH